MRSLGFVPTREDPNVWIRPHEEVTTYEYIEMHVHNFLIVSKTPQNIMELFQEKFNVRDIELDPSIHLCSEWVKRDDNLLQIHSEKYIKEAIRQCEKEYGEITREKNP